jgi:ubiquinone/menaquinone biosynthesis C-methylase UbiE
VDSKNYSSSFGFQWNRFRSVQIDTHNQTQLSEKRFYSETAWTKDELKDAWVLDAGCGAGRFLDVSSKACRAVVGVDISNAVDAAKINLAGRKNVHLVQASIFKLPFKAQSFDGAYCIGVIQHTPDPLACIEALPRVIKNGSKLALTIYERRPWTRLNSKYWIRPITKRLNPKFLLKSIQTVMPFIYPITEFLFRIPFLNRLFKFLIPVTNYVEMKELNMKQRYQWAVLDTFDMLAPHFDQPLTEFEARTALEKQNLGPVTRLKNSGLNLVARTNENKSVTLH